MLLEDSKGTYVSYKVKNNEELYNWFKDQDIKVIPKEELHCTLAFSRKKFPYESDNKEITIKSNQFQEISSLGDEGAVVLKFESKELQNNFDKCMKAGATYDYENYTPHITLTYDGNDLDLSKLKLPKFDIILYDDKAEELDLDWKDKLEDKMEESMPNSIVKSFADKSGKSVAEVEKLWKELKDEYGDNYEAITGTLKKILKINEAEELDEAIKLADIEKVLGKGKKSGKYVKFTLKDGSYILYDEKLSNPLEYRAKDGSLLPNVWKSVKSMKKNLVQTGLLNEDNLDEAKVTSKRASEILKSKVSQGNYKSVMTKDEIDYVNKVWDKLPGNKSFVDALSYISKQIKENEMKLEEKIKSLDNEVLESLISYMKEKELDEVTEELFEEFMTLQESVVGDFQTKIKKAKKGECESIMDDVQKAFDNKKLNQKEFEMLTALISKKQDQLGESLESLEEACKKKIEEEEGYKEYFTKMLKKFGVEEPDELPDDKKKEFYNAVDAGWKGENEEPEPEDKKEMKESLDFNKLANDKAGFISDIKELAFKSLSNNADFKDITDQMTSFVTEAKITEKDFLDQLLDIAENEKSINYMKMSTKDIIGEIVTLLRTNKKYNKLYDFWTKNRSQDLLNKIEKLFD